MCHAAARLHSHYERTVADLPWGRHAVCLRLRVRRFGCPVPACRRRVFAERVPTLVAPYGRRTLRLRAVLGLVAVALGGEAGARLLERLRMPASPATLLRLMRQMPLPAQPPVRVIGIDDFALRRSHRYGTVIVDHDQRRPVNLLPDRTADTLAAWLQRHDTLTAITRDRSTEYARGIAAGAPHAVEILDRWHVHTNLREGVERVLTREQQAVQGIALAAPWSEAAGRGKASREERFLAAPPRSRAEQAGRQAKREQRQRRYAAIRRLHGQGVSQRAIGQRLRCSRWLVRRALSSAAVPERPLHWRQPSMLDSFEPYLQQRWTAG